MSFPVNLVRYQRHLPPSSLPLVSKWREVFVCRMGKGNCLDSSKTGCRRILLLFTRVIIMRFMFFL